MYSGKRHYRKQRIRLSKIKQEKQPKLLALTLAPITTDKALESEANEGNVIDDRTLDAHKQWTDNFRRQVNLDIQSD